MKRMMQIDILKALAIVGVIINHWMNPPLHDATYAGFHILQAVPVFFILMAHNLRLSLDHRCPGASLDQLYASGYVGRRLKRLLPPLAIALTIGIVWAVAHDNSLYLGPQSLALRMPIVFPGQFFIAVSIFFVFLMPAVYACYKRWPRTTMCVGLLLSALYEVASPFRDNPSTYYLYQVNPLRFMGLLVLGFWLVDDANPMARRNRLMLPAALMSIAFLAAHAAGLRSDFIGPEYAYNVAASGWPLLLAAAGLTWLPGHSANRWLTSLAVAGRASYHIFLVQGLWFGGVNTGIVRGDPSSLVMSLIVCLGVGVAWYRLEYS